MSLLKAKTKVLLDTNALLLFGQGRDVFAEIEALLNEPFEFVVLEPVLAEVEKLAEKASVDGRAAKLALALVKARERQSSENVLSKLVSPSSKKRIPLKIVRGSRDVHADDALFATADGDAIVATLDKGLQRRLKCRVLSVSKNRISFIKP